MVGHADHDHGQGQRYHDDQRRREPEQHRPSHSWHQASIASSGRWPTFAFTPEYSPQAVKAATTTNWAPAPTANDTPPPTRPSAGISTKASATVATVPTALAA